MTHRELIKLAQDTLDDDEFRVWFAKHYQGYGRRSGGLMLGIGEDAFRYRLNQADLKMTNAIRAQEEAA